MAMTLYCRDFEQPNFFDRNWIEDEDACEHCGAKGQWRTLNEPKKPYRLSHNDRTLLHSFKIDPQE